MSGFVYLFHAVGTDRYKIGFTTLEPAQRLQAIQTASPHKLEVIAHIWGDKITERQLHYTFHEYRMHGEWFCFPDISVLYDTFPALQRGEYIKPVIIGNRPKKIWDEHSIALELCHQLLAYAEQADLRNVRAEYADIELTDDWYLIAEYYKGIKKRPVLTEFQLFELLRMKMNSLDADIPGPQN